MKTAVLITGLLLLLVANLIMVYYSPYGISPVEGFQNAAAAAAGAANAPMPVMNAAAEAAPNAAVVNMPAPAAAEATSIMGANSNVPASNAAPASAPANTMAAAAAMPMNEAPAPVAPAVANSPTAVEGFASYFLSNAGGSKDSYEPIGAFDAVKLKTGNSSSSWRYTAPNEPLMGPAFEPGPDSLFMFKSNQCKPECCGASFSCGGGCVCTTPEQRQYIASRGGNRTAPEDSP